MGVEVLGVLKNANGPKGDMILVRLSGAKAEYTGVVAGMSGSPVYFDGKLAGALAFRIGEFSKEPIAGVTPIAEMLEINAMDQSPEAGPAAAKTRVRDPARHRARARRPTFYRLRLQNFANYLKPIETPLVFNGFSEDAIQRFAPQFASGGNCSGDGRRFGQRCKAAGARRSRVRRSARSWCAAIWILPPPAPSPTWTLVICWPAAIPSCSPAWWICP